VTPKGHSDRRDGVGVELRRRVRVRAVLAHHRVEGHEKAVLLDRSESDAARFGRLAEARPDRRALAERLGEVDKLLAAMT
jgi:hypothetical protein